jgi:hypothetical protein
LQIIGQVADGGALVGGVEDEIALAVFGLDDGHEARVLDVGGNLNGGDHVVAEERRVVRIDNAAAVVDRDVEGVNAGDLEHGDEQGGLVFAVAVLVAIDIGGVICLQAADAAHDDEVADVFLDEVGDAGELGVEVGCAGDEALRLGGNFRGGIGRLASSVVTHWPMARHWLSVPSRRHRPIARTCGRRRRTHSGPEGISRR